MTDPQRILVTGASRGLGRALTDHLLRQGHSVFGCSRGESTLEDKRYTHFQGDVTDESSVKRLFQAIRKQWGGLDAVVNNAGAARMLPIALTPVDTVRKVMEVNYVATFQVSHGAIRLLKKSPSPRIINLTTVAVPLRLEGEAAYAAAKSAIETLTRVMAKELGPMSITCNAVGPSPIRTDLISKVPEDKLEALIAAQAIHEWATPEDFINVVDFFLRPQSRLITGQIIYLGGHG